MAAGAALAVDEFLVSTDSGGVGVRERGTVAGRFGVNGSFSCWAGWGVAGDGGVLTRGDSGCCVFLFYEQIENNQLRGLISQTNKRKTYIISKSSPAPWAWLWWYFKPLACLYFLPQSASGHSSSTGEIAHAFCVPVFIFFDGICTLILPNWNKTG